MTSGHYCSIFWVKTSICLVGCKEATLDSNPVEASSYFTLLSICTHFNLPTRLKTLQNQPVFPFLLLCLPVGISCSWCEALVFLNVSRGCIDEDLVSQRCAFTLDLYKTLCLLWCFCQSYWWAVPFTPREHDALQTLAPTDMLDVFNGNMKLFK